MDPILNPYTPNAGATPSVLVGRDDQLALFDILLGRLSRGYPEQSMIITGLRGVGKTVLLNAFGRKVDEFGWQVIDLEVAKFGNSDFRRRLAHGIRQSLLRMSPPQRWRERMRRAMGVLRSFTLSIDPDGVLTAGMSTVPVEGQGDAGDLALDLTDMLVALGEAAREEETGVVLLLDEIQFLSRDQLEGLISALHKTVQKSLPITMVAAGLPQIVELAGEAKSYSERLFKFPVIDHFNNDDARRALLDPAQRAGVGFDDDALDMCVELTEGYPYFLQEIGYAAWSIARDNVITRQTIDYAIPQYTDKLDESFFRVRMDRTTELERAYLRAMAQLGHGAQSAGDVARLLNRTSQQCAPTRSSLIQKGLLYATGFGYAKFTVPQFDRFMLRAMPQLVVPEVRSRTRGPAQP